MYILFINSDDKCNIFFSIQFNNNSNKKKIIQHMGLTRSNPTHVGWVGLNLYDELGWVEYFFTHHIELGQKNILNSTRPNPCTPLLAKMNGWMMFCHKRKMVGSWMMQ